MPELKPFRAWRYATTDLLDVTAPPYDVLSEAEVAGLRARDEHNIVHVDVPEQTPAGYATAAAVLRAWMADGTLTRDAQPSLTLYKLGFTDATGTARETIGVLGALAVLDYPASARTATVDGEAVRHTRVLPHEHVTAKASTDRLDLTRATNCNLSPVWGLSLTDGLTGLLHAAWDASCALGVKPASLTEKRLTASGKAGVTHSALPLFEPSTIGLIEEALNSSDVLIADGHHRYGVAQRYRDEQHRGVQHRGERSRDERRAAEDAPVGPADYTLAFINELVDDQLSIEAIHRVYDGVDTDALRGALAAHFDLSPAPVPSPALLAEMKRLGRLVLLAPGGSATWLTPKPGAFDGVRALDGAWLEHALAGLPGLAVEYQHGLDEVVAALAGHAGAVLIRPTSIEEIRRTATEGLLMPPKSTFFTPKLRTGLVVRQLDE